MTASSLIADLGYLAARLSLDILEHEEILEVVEGAADPTKYPDMLVDYVGTSEALDRALRSFRAYPKDKSITVPAQQEAVWLVVQHHLSRIVAGKVSPEQGLRSFTHDLWDFVLTKAPVKKHVGDFYGVEKLVGMYWARDDLLDEDELTEELQELLQRQRPADVRQAARDWLDTYGERFPKESPGT